MTLRARIERLERLPAGSELRLTLAVLAELAHALDRQAELLDAVMTGRALGHSWQAYTDLRAMRQTLEGTVGALEARALLSLPTAGAVQ